VGQSPGSSRKLPSSPTKADSATGRVLSDVTELPPTVTVEHAAKLLGVSRSAAYRAAARGELPTIAFGRRRLVPTRRLLELLGLSVEEQR
jgi:excisionase family DNA binding protein